MTMLVKSGIKTAVSAFGVAFCLFAGSAMATPVVVTSATESVGGVSVQLNHSPAPVGDPVSAGRIDLGTAAGILQSYCVDIFHYTATPTTYDMNLLSASSTYSNGTSTVNWTATQVNRIEALLIAAANPALVAQTALNTASLQIAIWEVEYGTVVAATGKYDVTDLTHGISFSSTSDALSGSAIAQAQTYLNNVTSNIWAASANYAVEYLTAAGVQNQVTLATVPEPASIGIFGLGLAGLWAARRRKTA